MNKLSISTEAKKGMYRGVDVPPPLSVATQGEVICDCGIGMIYIS